MTHFVGVQTDVTERVRLEEQVRQSQKMEAIGQLAGGIAHDFNNLVTIINGYSEILLRGVPAADPRNKHLTLIHHAGERAATLTRQLLTFSRKQAVTPVVLDIAEVAANLEKMLRRVLGEDIDLVTTLQPGVGFIKADAGQVEQVIMNLAVNARDAMPQGGSLVIEAATCRPGSFVLTAQAAAQIQTDIRDSYVVLTVTDTGHGMDAATQAHIFEPFFTTKEVGKGTGLGLATVYGIVKQSGGHIAVESEPGKGTTFRVYFPRVEKVSPTSKSDPGPTKLPQGQETILLVEDEEGVREFARHVLDEAGYRVLEARDGPEARRVSEAHQGPIHLLVTDVVMPQMSGRQVAEALGAQRPTLKVLYLSGYTDDAVMRHGIREAEVAFLPKPFTPSILAQKVREVLDG